jgi:hypothetical protein
MNLKSVDLAHHVSIGEWTPQIGDVIIWHGWFTHYFSVVSSILREENAVEVIKKGLPILLFSMTSVEYRKNTIKIDIDDIRGSVGGKYAAVRAIRGNLTWYI